MRSGFSRLAMTLLEVILVMGLFSVIMMVASALLGEGVGLWKNVSGSQAAGMELKKAQRLLEQDLAFASSGKLQTVNVPASLGGGGFDGSALWFLSMTDPATGRSVRDADGNPFWQRNIVYYLVVPAGHTSCPGGMGPAGLDDRCPHKVLIRKVIDSGPTTTPTSDPNLDAEVLLPDVTPYLTRPQGADLSAMYSEPGVMEVQVAANRLFWFQVSLGPDPRYPKELQLDLGAVSLDDARKAIRLGVDPLTGSRFSLCTRVTILPPN